MRASGQQACLEVRELAEQSGIKVKSGTARRSDLCICFGAAHIINKSRSVAQLGRTDQQSRAESPAGGRMSCRLPSTTGLCDYISNEWAGGALHRPAC